MSRPGYHVDVATTAIPAAIAQPPGGIQTAGFPAHSKFASAWANWLFNYLGGWTRELDQSCLRAIDCMSTTTAVLLKGADVGLILPESSGLVNLLPEDGGTYVLFGRRVDLSLDGLLVKYPTGFTLPSNSTVYAHAREEIAAGGSSTGDLIFSTNASEPDYKQIWRGTTDGADLISQQNTADTSAQWVLPVDFTGPITITDASNETAFAVVANSSFAPGSTIYNNGGGTGLQVVGGNNSTGIDLSLGAGVGQCTSAIVTGGLAGSAAHRVTLGGASWGLDVTNNGSRPAVHITTTSAGGGVDITSSGATALTIVGGATAMDVTPAAAGTGLQITGGSASGDGVFSFLPNGNTTGFAVRASTGASAGSSSRAVRALAGNNGIALEAAAAANNAGLFSTTGATTAVVITAANGVGLDVSSNGNGANGNYALKVTGDLTSPTKAQMSFGVQNARPTSTTTGDLTVVHSASQALGLCGGFSDLSTRSYWHSVNGYACAFQTAYGYGNLGYTQTNATFAVVGTITTATVGDEVKVAGATILVRLSLSVKSNSAVDTIMSVRVRDVTNGNAVVWERVGTGSADAAGYFVPANDAGTGRYWVPGPYIEFAVVAPTAGSCQYTVSVAAPTVVPFRIRDLTAAFVGTVG